MGSTSHASTFRPTNLDDVLGHIRSKTLKRLLFSVALKPARKTLSDGRNAHLIQETPNWWLTWLLPRFTLHSFQAGNGDFTALLMPLQIQEATNEN